MSFFVIGGSFVILVAIFGVSMANFALKQERLERHLEEPSAPDAYPSVVWWQEIGSEHEFHLSNGEVWRGLGELNWARVPDGKSVEQPFGEYLAQLARRIRFDDAEMIAKHAWRLLKWEPDPHGYRLTLLNGEEWVWSFKRKQWGDNPRSYEIRWQPHGVPNSTLRDVLDRRLDDVIRESAQQKQRAIDAAIATLTSHDTGLPTGVQVSNTCDACGITRVSIPGGICRVCREARG